MNELKPCPFCGETVHYCKMFGAITGIECFNCGAIVSFVEKENREDAVSALNRRTNKLE